MCMSLYFSILIEPSFFEHIYSNTRRKKMEIAISLPATCQQLLIYIGCPKLTLFQQNQNFIYRVFWVWECNSMIEFLLMSRRSQVQSLAPASKVKCSISNAELDWPVIWLKAACICQFSHFFSVITLWLCFLDPPLFSLAKKIYLILDLLHHVLGQASVSIKFWSMDQL